MPFERGHVRFPVYQENDSLHAPPPLLSSVFHAFVVSDLLFSSWRLAIYVGLL